MKNLSDFIFPSAVSHEQGSTIVGAPSEPQLDVAEIQGNILVGFNKDHQAFLFFRITNPSVAKQWLRKMVPQIANTDETLSFLRLFRAMRSRRQTEPVGLVATWLNIGFTRTGIEKLTSQAEAEKFASPAFKVGMAARAGLLGDETDVNGNPIGWKFGDSSNPVDFVLIVASDEVAARDDYISTIKQEIQKLQGVSSENANDAGIQLVFAQAGDTLPGVLKGHEHFGFKDGISQPGIRGRASKAPLDFLTPRLIDPADSASLEFSRPGQPLVWPGQFVLGAKYPTQNPFDSVKPGPVSSPSPLWASNGSFLVIRRLNQDVSAFWNFMASTAAALKSKYPQFGNLTTEMFATLVVGRWPSGAPLMRTPLADNPLLASHEFAANNFAFTNAAPAIRIVAGQSSTPDNFPTAPADDAGLRCPFATHIRKVNPRDDTTDLGGPERTLLKRILRRGIPFGPPLPHPLDVDSKDDERGLLFVCYQAAIEDQFEFLTTDWVNSDVFPRAYGNVAGGQDPVIGRGAGATRSFALRIDANTLETLTLPSAWVTGTGGEYFFSPSITALRDVLAH